MSKFLWELKPQDFIDHAIWQFEYWKDDSVDETVVTPASLHDISDPNALLIVRAIFTDANGRKFHGYMNHGSSGVEHTQPCMFVDDESVGFWFGISKPPCNELPSLSFPIEVKTHDNCCVALQIETIRGYGYIEMEFGRAVRYC